MSENSNFLFLAEMFPNLELDVIERILHTKPTDSLLRAPNLQTLIDRCLAQQSTMDSAAAKKATFASSTRSAPTTVSSLSSSPSSSSSLSSVSSVSSSSSSTATATPTSYLDVSYAASAPPLEDLPAGFEMTSLVPATSGLPEPSAPTVSTEHFTLMSAFADIHGGILAATAPHTAAPPNTSPTSSAPASAPQLLRSLNALLHIITNVLQSPSVEKYRILPLSNPNFQQKVLSLHASKTALTALGWVEVEGSDVLVMSEDNFDRELLEEGKRYVEEEIAFVSALLPPTPPVPASTRAASPYARYDTITDNPLYRSKRDWKNDGDKPLHFPLTPTPVTPRLSRDQLAALAEHRLRPKSTPAPILPPGASGEARQGRVMRLEAMRRRRAEIEAMRRDKRDTHWSTTAAGRKRILTLDDIARMRKEELDSKARMCGGMSTDEQYERIGREAVRLTNEFRRSQGLHSEVEWSDRVAEIGWEHSKAMGDGERPFSHDKFSERASAMGFASSGENVWMGSGVAGVEVAKMAVDGWISSPGHRKNLLGERWTVCGIGVYRNEHGTWYLTQLFGSG